MPDADYGGGNYNSGYGSGGTSTTGSTTTGGTTTGGTTTGGTTTGGTTTGASTTGGTTANNGTDTGFNGGDTANNGADTSGGGFEGGNTSGLSSGTDTTSTPSLSGGIGGLVGAATGGNLDTNSLAGLANWSGPSSTPAPDDNNFGPRSDTGFGGWDTMSDMSGPIGITGDLTNVTGQPTKDYTDRVGDYVGGPSIGYSMDEASADWGYGVDRALTNMQTANALGEDISSVADDPGIMGTDAARQFPAAGTTGTAMTGFSPQVGLPGPADWADALYGDPVLGGLATPTGVPGMAGPTQHPQFAGSLDQPVGQPYSNWDLSPSLNQYAMTGTPTPPQPMEDIGTFSNLFGKTDMEQPNQTTVEQNGIFNKDQSRIVTRADGTSIEVPSDVVANPNPEVKAALDAWDNPAVYTGMAQAAGQPYGITNYPTSYPSYDAPADAAIPDIEPPPDFEPNPGYTDPNVQIATKVPPQIVPPDDLTDYYTRTDGIYQRPGWIAQNGGLNVQAASADPDNRNDTGGTGSGGPKDGGQGLDWLFRYYGRQPGYQTVVPTQANVRMAPISQGMGTLLRRVQIQNI